MSNPGYLVMPQTSAPEYSANTQYHPSFPLSYANASSSGRPRSISINVHPSRPAAFRAPAHKHAHHLHSIPPREKSTRTLIIDHMACVHARTRFAQARAELGMTDLTGGPTAATYANRDRPESYSEDAEVHSDGEDVDVLTGVHSAPASAANSEVRWGARKDLPLARTLRARAEGLEKVVTSMLEQPPELRPSHPNEADAITPPSSPKSLTRRNPLHNHPHTLPDGVRLRLALGTLVNDLFAREPRTIDDHSPSANARQPHPHAQNAYDFPSLASLASVSTPTVQSASFTSYFPTTPATPSTPQTDAHSAMLYNAGSQPSAAGLSPHAQTRCARHLLPECLLCVAPAPRARRGGIGSGLRVPGAPGSVLRRRSRLGGSTRLAELLPRFLRLSALVALELGREARDGTNSYASSETGEGGQPMQSPGEALPFRPRREWYMLLAGLATRAALEGYASGAWRGTRAAEVLLGIGVEGVGGRDEIEMDPEGFAWFEPDEMLGLGDSVCVLFSSMGAMGVDENETEYRREMRDRLRKFLGIPGSTPDLLTHLLHLSALFPAEPVERAALRFCEAVAKWRGKPELGSDAKPVSGAVQSPDAADGMSLYVRSNPSSPVQPQQPASASISTYAASSAPYPAPSSALPHFQMSHFLEAEAQAPRAPIQKYFEASAQGWPAGLGALWLGAGGSHASGKRKANFDADGGEGKRLRV